MAQEVPVYVNLICPTCKVEVSANVTPEKVFPTDGYDARKAYCLKCRKEIPIWVMIDLEEPKPPVEETGIRLDPAKPDEFRKQVTEMAGKMGYWLAWRKKK